MSKNQAVTGLSEAGCNASIAVLASGGLDSAILIAELAVAGLSEAGYNQSVHPLYLREGLYWESAELEHLRRFLLELDRPAVRPLVVLEMPVADVYGKHWSMTGEGAPDADSPDEAVHLPGRNLLLLAKALLWCRLNEVAQLALAPLAANPFPDASDDFFRRMEELSSLALGGRVAIRRPYARLHKAEVIARGRGLPLQWTFSCIRPIDGRHCGRCNKCAERRRAFAEAGVTDPTKYAS